MKVRIFLILYMIFTISLLHAEEPKKVKLTISPETTYFTEPRSPDGRVDYFAALNCYFSEGITKENNILTGLFTFVAGEQEVGLVLRSRKAGEETSGAFSPFRDKFWKLLNYDAPPDLKTLHLLHPVNTGESLKTLQKYYSQKEIDAKLKTVKEKERKLYQARIDSKDTTPENKESFRNVLKNLDTMTDDWLYKEIITEERDKSFQNLWTAKELPVIDGWMKSTDSIAEKLLEIAKRPRCYHPMVPNDTECTYFSLLPYSQSVRQSARYLSIRGHWLFTQGKHEDAFEYAFANLCMGMVLQQDGECLVTVLFGISIEAMSQYDMALYLHELQNPKYSTKKDTTWILAKKKEYDALVSTRKIPFPPRWSVSERCGLLSAVQWFLSDPENAMKTLLEDLDDNKSEKVFKKCYDPKHDYNWDEVFKRINLYFDDQEDILALPLLQQQRKALDRMEMRIQETTQSLEIRAENIEKWKHVPFAKEQLLADYFTVTFFPGVRQPFQAVLRNVASERMVSIIFALAAYRAEHGTYPQTLEELTPRFLNEIPLSPYIDKAIRYVNRSDKILLLSNDTCTLDGSETEIEKKISEAGKPVAFVQPFVGTTIIVLQK